MIIDTHHHFWRYNPEEYGWMDDAMSILKHDYLPEDLKAELGKAGIEGTVVVQARQSIEETRWLLDLSDRYDFIAGVVGWLDLPSAELSGQLKEFAEHPKLVGVRHVLHDEADEGFMLRPDFMKGIGQLEAHHLAYDLLLFPRHLRSSATLAGNFPGVRFVLDHLGKPEIRAGKMEPWRSEMAGLAAHGNVWCKLSGMVTEADWKEWTYEDLLPYMEVVLDTFGPDRILIGSDWPVCRLAGEYGEVMEIVLRFVETMDEEIKARILYQNAFDCYQLKTYH